MTLVYVLLALAGAGVTGLTMYFIGKGRRPRVDTAFWARQLNGLADRLDDWEEVAAAHVSNVFELRGRIEALEQGLSIQNDVIAENQQSTFKLMAKSVLPPPAPARVQEPVIDMKSLLELVHQQQLGMIGMVAGVVKDISEHAAATVTAPLLAQMQRAAPPPSQMIAPVPWYGREDVAVADGADPLDSYMHGGNPYYPNNAAAPTGGYVMSGDDEPFGIPGLKWPAMQEGMVKPGTVQ